MDNIFEAIHAMATDKATSKFQMTSKQAVELDYLLDELKRWRETGLTRPSDPDNALSDGISYIQSGLTSAKAKNSDYVRLEVNRVAAFARSLEAVQDYMRYAMLGGVPCEKGKTRVLEITFPLEVSVVGHIDDTRDTLIYMDEIKSALASALDTLGEDGLWGMYPDSTKLYLKVKSLWLTAKENEFDEVDGAVKVTISESLTGYDVASIIRFVSRQMTDWLAWKIRSFTFESDDGEQLAVSVEDAKDAAVYTPEPLFERKSDYSVLRERMFDMMSNQMVERDGQQVHAYIVAETCAEVSGSPGSMITVTDTVNHERMTFAFDMTGKLC